MGIEIITIGDELVNGVTLNTNSSFVSKELVTRGYSVSRHTVLPDDEKILLKNFKEALKRSDFIIVTGGLGPTCDDITKKVLLKTFECKLKISDEIKEGLIKRFGKNLVSLDNQSHIPEKALFFKNTLGTAPGLMFKTKEAVLVALPGVPQEMHEMFANWVLPYLEKNYQKDKIFSEKMSFCLLKENDVYPAAEAIKEKNKVAFTIYPSYGTLSLCFSGEKLQVEKAKKELLKKFPNYDFVNTIEEAVKEKLTEQKKTLILAESCTGGLIASKLTSCPGASNYFLGSFVTYSNELKEKILNVPKTVLKNEGAVSEKTVFHMCEGALKLSGADFAIAVSGIAGPGGGTTKKPVGTVCIAIGEKNGQIATHTFLFKGTRETINLLTAYTALGNLWRKIAFKTEYFSP